MLKIRSMLGCAAVLAATMSATFAADEVPTFDVGKSCKSDVSAYRSTSNEQEIRSGCQSDEQTARAKLVSNWKQYTSASKRECITLQGGGSGPQSYVELLTCLEMAQQVKDLPKD
jgi:hypothetical protein